jgi:hypothetical protein
MPYSSMKRVASAANSVSSGASARTGPAQANEKTVTAARRARCLPMLNVRIVAPPARIMVAHHNVGRGTARYSRADDGWYCERRDRRS